MSDEKSFQYAKRMFPLFHAIVKFCSTNILFTLISVGGGRASDLQETLSPSLFSYLTLVFLFLYWLATQIPCLLHTLIIILSQNMTQPSQTSFHYTLNNCIFSLNFSISSLVFNLSANFTPHTPFTPCEGLLETCD